MEEHGNRKLGSDSVLIFLVRFFLKKKTLLSTYPQIQNSNLGADTGTRTRQDMYVLLVYSLDHNGISLSTETVVCCSLLLIVCQS